MSGGQTILSSRTSSTVRGNRYCARGLCTELLWFFRNTAACVLGSTALNRSLGTPFTSGVVTSSASTSNRNFEGRQGKGGRTHLVSPDVAVATGILGHLAGPADLAELAKAGS